MSKEQAYPKGWNQERVERVIKHYESQTDDAAIAEDEAAYEHDGTTLVEVPDRWLPRVRKLVAELAEQDGEANTG